jgi:integrase
MAGALGMADRKKIGLREVRALGPGEEIWDPAVAGFGARRQAGENVSYVLMYRRDGRKRRYTIGRHGSPWTPDSARAEAVRLLGEIIKGADPGADKRGAREAMTVAELCDAYLADAIAGRLLTRRGQAKKASTLAIDVGRIERHIKPLLGRLAVAAVDRTDVERFMHDVAAGKTAAKAKSAKKRGLARVTGGRTAATRAVGLLGSIFGYAVRHRMRPDNPAHGLQRFADGKRDRRLSEDEFSRLGTALSEAEEARQDKPEAIWLPALAMGRFLLLSGWRTGEAAALRWPEIDLARRTATLSDTKTGRSMRPLSNPVCDLLKAQPQMAGDRVFPASRGGPATILHFKKIWPRIAKLAGLPTDVTPHTLRHSFASVAADLGYSEPTIAALVGHTGRSVTSRYVHSADAVLLAAADAVANRISELMGDEKRVAAVVPLRAAR